MKITNFRLKERTGNSALNWKFKALVTVRTGLFFKKMEDKEIYKEYGGYWCFVDTGKFTPGHSVEELQRKYEAEIMEEIKHCEIKQ